MESAWILALGTELTLGQSIDTNSAWLARQLAEHGIRCRRHLTLADDLDEIRRGIDQAARAADLVLVTGGLGPTDDDLTRQALADAAGTTLELNTASVERIREFFARRGRAMPKKNQVQGLLPVGGRALPNDCGTAPGIFLTIHGTPVYSMPGVPAEMKAMFAAAVAPDLAAAAAGQVLCSRTIRTYGMPESELGEKIRDLMARGRNPEVGTTASFGDIGVRIYARAEGGAAAAALLDETEAEVRRRLGRFVYGRDADTLAEAVGAALLAHGASIAVAESCTGGLIGALLTDVPGSSRYFRGGVLAYANDVKESLLGVRSATLAAHGAVSAETACEMAAGAAKRLNATYALSATGIAGPDGGSETKPVGLVYVGLAGPGGVEARKLRLGGDQGRAVVRERAARGALNWLRLALRRDDWA